MRFKQFSEAFQGSFLGTLSGHALCLVSVSGKFYGVSYSLEGVSDGEECFLNGVESLRRGRGLRFQGVPSVSRVLGGFRGF